MIDNPFLNGAGMRRRSWWLTTLSGLTLLFLAMILTSMKTIEDDLEQRILQRLSFDEIGWVAVVLGGHGRDVVLTGVAPSIESREIVGEIIRNLHGVRHVDNRLKVMLSDLSPEFSLRQEAGRVLLRGRLASQAAVDFVVDAAEAIYGEDKVTNELDISNQLERADWVAGVSGLFARLASARSAQLVISSRVSRLTAEVDSHGERLKMVYAAKKLLGSELETEVGVWVPPESLDVLQNAAQARTVVAGTDPALVVCQAKIDRELIGKKLFFASDTAELDPSSQPLLDQVIGVLEQCNAVAAAERLSVTGYNVGRAGEATDQAMSRKRAEAVTAYLANAANAAGLVSRIRYAEASLAGLVDSGRGGATKPAIGFNLEHNL